MNNLLAYVIEAHGGLNAWNKHPFLAKAFSLVF